MAAFAMVSAAARFNEYDVRRRSDMVHSNKYEFNKCNANSDNKKSFSVVLLSSSSGRPMLICVRRFFSGFLLTRLEAH